MSAQENFQKKCKCFFDKCNGGGAITLKQLVGVIREACPSFKGEDSEIAAMFVSVDYNDDNLVTWDEFSSALFAKNPKEVTRAELEEQFKLADSDGNGKLVKEEIRNLSKRDLKEETLERLLSEADEDGDGKISIQEFLDAWNATDE